MTDAELDEVEAALGRPLPADYRQFVRDCPAADWDRYCNYLYVSPKDMIRENRDHPRRAPDSNVCEPNGAGGNWERPWPAEWTIVGDADSEWYVFVRSDQPGVWVWQHDTQAVSQAAASFGEYLEHQRERIGPPPVREVTRHPTLGDRPAGSRSGRTPPRCSTDTGLCLRPTGASRTGASAPAAGWS
jgi:hypothetical protein